MDLHGACSSVALAGFALPECPGSSPHVYPTLEGLTAVVLCGLVPPPSRVRPSMCTPVTLAVPYLLLGLQDVQWAVGNSRGARKLARTPHLNKKKKERKNGSWIYSILTSSCRALASSVGCLLYSPCRLGAHFLYTGLEAHDVILSPSGSGTTRRVQKERGSTLIKCS
jgi:hypothetical protein